jgi:hypothetical protein
MTNIEKVILGALDGLAAVAVKFPGQDDPTLATHAADATPIGSIREPAR